MDRFKFRVWDSSANAYVPRSQFILLSDGTLIQEIGGEEVIWESTQPEFCTGIKDKNGKLIYEGDELKDWKNNNFVIAFDEEYAQFVAKDERGWVSPIERDILDDCEIIGNIHTNPDLLGAE